MSCWLLKSCRSRSRDNRQRTSFLSLPLEIRLIIYSLIIGTSECWATPIPYLHFTMIDTGAPEISLYRSGFRKWDHSKNNVWAKWPDRDTQALYGTCRQINLDLREDFHPGPLALKVMDDLFFNLCAGDKLYSAIDGRSWILANVGIFRLEIRAWDEVSESPPNLRPWRANHEKNPTLETPWAARERVRRHRLWRQRFRKQALLSQTDPHDLRKLSRHLKNLPRLKKIELFLRSTDEFWIWADPFGDFQAVQDVGAKFCVIVDSKISLGRLWSLIMSRGGGIYLTSAMDGISQQLWSPERVGWLSNQKRQEICLVSGDKAISVPVYVQYEQSGLSREKEWRGFAASRRNFINSFT